MLGNLTGDAIQQGDPRELLHRSSAPRAHMTAAGVRLSVQVEAAGVPSTVRRVGGKVVGAEETSWCSFGEELFAANQCVGHGQWSEIELVLSQCACSSSDYASFNVAGWAMLLLIGSILLLVECGS
ncbi:hypothetical protein NPIL_39531 [Nephila pilipes]|uniref:Uncharacterized protein n=1 Tax=Nephila pilipes TaxID=299642 RepID=A0A8X6QX74_NEPPI|nr:hypothetical protein NPIL_39531 [Nephila pilipes]